MGADYKDGAHLVFFDLETKRGSAQVGWSRISSMGLSLAVTYSERDGYQTFLHHQVKQLINYLKSADAVVGFNHVEFDYKVLSAYTDENLSALNNIDMFLIIYKRTGCKISLSKLARGSLGRGKSGDGLDAIRWYTEGRFDLIEKYCEEDVSITRDLYYLGCEQGYVSYLEEERIVDVAVDWTYSSGSFQFVAPGLRQCLKKDIDQNISELGEDPVKCATKASVSRNDGAPTAMNNPAALGDGPLALHELSQLMEEYERLQAIADEAQAQANQVAAKIKEIVLTMGKTQKSGRVIASYTKGRGSYDYQSMAAAISPPEELIEQYTKRIIDWRTLCKDARLPKEIQLLHRRKAVCFS
jgi:hypothetical protein